MKISFSPTIRFNSVNAASWLPYIAAAVFSIVTVLIFSALRSDYFSAAANYDRLSYVTRATELQQTGGFDFSFSNFSALFSAELGWTLLLFLMTRWFESVETGLNLLAVFSLFVYTLFCFKNNTRSWVAFLFLINPVVIDLVMCQSRSAFAVAILMIAFMARRKRWLLILGLLAQSIHASSVIFIAVYVVATYLSSRLNIFNFSVRKATGVLIASGFALAVLLGRTLVLGAGGDVRASLQYGSSSLLYSCYWFFLLFVLIALPKVSGKRSWQYFYTICILVLFFFFSIASFYNMRFITMSFPIIINTVHEMQGNLRLVLFSLLFLYQLVQYAYWVQQ